MANVTGNQSTINNIKKDTNNLCREDFDGGPVSVDEIEKGLYLGNLTAATNIETLKSLNITHILTMDSVPLPAHIAQVSFLTTKYVHISDMPKEDILHRLDDCIEFIESALNNGKNILVHCYFGVSRSSSIIIAYIMKKHNYEFQQAFEKIKSKRKYVQPNSGFVCQLKLYRRMGCKIDPLYPKYKTYRLRLAADNVKKAKILPQTCMDIIKPDPGVTQENPEPLVYRCRKCRRIVATHSNILSHVRKNHHQLLKTYDESSNSEAQESNETDELKNCTTLLNPMRKTSISEKSSENDDEAKCKSVLFIEPIAWMKDILNQTQGRLNCPKCMQKLGSFSWINGCHCPCGMEISPAFYLVPSKVELSHMVQNVQTTL